MPYFISIGVSKWEFLDSTPKELNVYIDAERMREKRADAERWYQGMYNMSAFSTVLSRALSKKSQAEYMKEPMSERMATKADESNMTEEQKQAERDKLLMALKVMQANFELNHRDDIGAEE